VSWNYRSIEDVTLSRQRSTTEFNLSSTGATKPGSPKQPPRQVLANIDNRCQSPSDAPLASPSFNLPGRRPVQERHLHGFSLRRAPASSKPTSPLTTMSD
jgi:hypothetical protein